MAGLLLAALVLTACDAGDKGKPAASQASAADAGAKAVEPRLNSIDRSHAGEVAPALAFERRGGVATSLVAFRGRPVLVNLWATWCAPCLAEMPALDFLAVRMEGKLEVLPISQDLEGWPAVEGFFKAQKFRALEPRLDQPGAFAETLKARGLPMSILYDAQGREVWRVAGTLDWDSPEVEAALTGA
jgi:thiol-disulfide isomerase/thioredoxin